MQSKGLSRVFSNTTVQKHQFFSKHLLISWLQSPSAVLLDPPKIKSVTVCIISPSVCQIKRRLLLGRKVMSNLDSIFKSRDITLPTKVHLVKAMVFPVVMYACESWTVKKAERRRIDAFEPWCWRRLLTESLGLRGDPTSPS